MIYIASLIGGRYKSIMWLALSLRWGLHLALAHWAPVTALTLTIWVGVPLKFGFGFALLVGTLAFFGFSTYRDFVKIMAFRRRWPVVWNETLTTANQIQDLDDGHLNRRFAAAPKLGVTYRRNNRAIIFRVRPAVGATLVALQEQSNDLAAQYKNVDSIEISYSKPSAYRGELKLLLEETMREVKQSPDARATYVANA